MRRHIEHIRNQPEHVRFLWTLGCTAVVSLFVVMAWFRSFERTGYALLNPDQAAQAGDGSQFAKNQNESLFASIGQTVKDGAAAIGSVWSSIRTDQSAPIQQQSTDAAAQPAAAPHPLPVSGNK